MNQRFNDPTVQYCIEARMAGTKVVVDRFTIEQNEGTRPSKDRVDGCYNAVQRHLSELSVRTTLDYEIVRWGYPKDRTSWLEGRCFED